MNIFRAKKPYIIAGPCGAEDEEQLHEVAKAISNLPVSMMRAGVWKPRSKPGNFEGRGEIALQWLQKIQQQFQLPVCIEVANQEQVVLALKYGMEAVWIGARTTVNPFMVQEIADAVKGTSLKVLIKNPINPDIELWSGAVERIVQAGITNIAAIHRGFSSYDPTTKYRNKPMWAIPIEFKRRYKNLPIVCDASHICGNTTLIPYVAQRALDLDFDGLMIETHPNPENALSDAKQQLTPEALSTLLAGLRIRKSNPDTSIEEIEAIRQIIDSMDAEIVDLLGKRMQLAKQLGEIKNRYNLPIYQVDRWREIIDSRTDWGKNNELNASFIKQLYDCIHNESIQTQIDSIKNLSKENTSH